MPRPTEVTIVTSDIQKQAQLIRARLAVCLAEIKLGNAEQARTQLIGISFSVQDMMELMTQAGNPSEG